MAEWRGQFSAVPIRAGQRRPEFKNASPPHNGAVLEIAPATSGDVTEPPAGEPIAFLSDTLWTSENRFLWASDLWLSVENEIQTAFDCKIVAHNRIYSASDTRILIAAQARFSADSELRISEPTQMLLADVVLTVQPPVTYLSDTQLRVGHELLRAFDTGQRIEGHIQIQADGLVEIGEFTRTQLDLGLTIFHVQLREEHPIAT